LPKIIDNNEQIKDIAHFRAAFVLFFIIYYLLSVIYKTREINLDKASPDSQADDCRVFCILYHNISL